MAVFVKKQAIVKKPALMLIAGCNGSGKSTFSQALAGSVFTPFDFDKECAKIYRDLTPKFDISDRIAHQKTMDMFEAQIEYAIATKTSFCYETNFDSIPMHWPQYFQLKGYTIHMIFLAVDSVLTAQQRVWLRYQNGGHIVSPTVIEEKYKKGFTNLDANFDKFHTLDIFDTSADVAVPQYLMSFDKGKRKGKYLVPNYLKKILPRIFSSMPD
jgi:predicted ABC-type ATPase